MDDLAFELGVTVDTRGFECKEIEMGEMIGIKKAQIIGQRLALFLALFLGSLLC